ncbi:tetratricopeptide repeat protein [Parvularcula maris]|uniref:Tetratricopeptide repeat protein n=1 Tax=Parvularcula maris TaxID=2965077 RepID=A0A9X2LAR3_9PROT|nr:tetratricopeptide repeat protein [Parvularcula maris]MCQ8186131.1 tetratricopeptide repeat protein [Parvularcula maris]
MASEEDVLLREVDEDLSRDQTLDRLRRWRVPLAVGAVAILGGVIGYQTMQNRAEAARTEAAESYAGLSFMAEEEVGSDALLAYAEETSGGYAVLAKMRAAAQLGASGDLEGARDLYAEVYGDGDLSVPMRDFARLRAAYLVFDRRPETAAEIAAGVESEAFRGHADEIASGAALHSGDYIGARAGFEALASSESAPQAVRARAATYAAVADAAANGTQLSAPETPTSFIDRLGSDLEAAGLPTGGAASGSNLQDLLTPPAPPTDEEADEDDATEERAEEPAGEEQP